MREVITGIYKITNPENKIYIGASKDIHNRWRRHRAIFNSKKQPKIYNSYLKFGIKNHLFEIIETCSIELLNERERYWQDFYDVCGVNGLNSTLNKTKSLPFYRSAESNEAIYSSSRGLKRTKEHVQAIKKAHTGKVSTLRGVALSETRKHNHSISSHRSKIVLDLSTGVYFNNIQEAAIAYNIKNQTLVDWLGRKKRNNKTNLMVV